MGSRSTPSTADRKRRARALPPICFLVANANWLIGQVRFPDTHLGQVVEMDDGQRFTVFRHAHLKRSAPDSPAIFIARFRFARFSQRTNRRLSLIPIPLIVGFPGFTDKIWMADEETGDWQGVYQFDSVEALEAYQRSFVFGLMNRRAEPGSLETWAIPNTSLPQFLALHRPRLDRHPAPEAVIESGSNPRRPRMFEKLREINQRPEPFQFYTARALWTDEYTSAQMLKYHLDGSVDLSSRRTGFLDRSAAFMTERFGLASGKRVADFGCGPGLYASRLAAAGARVTGIDFSERSIRYAREQAAARGLSIDYLQADYLEVDLDTRFDLIIMIMCDFCALSPAQRATLLGKFTHFLRPGGQVLLDVYSLAAFDQREESATYALNQLNGFWSPGPYYGFVNTFKYEREKVVLDKYTIVDPNRTRTVYNWLQYFEPEGLRREFEQAGLKLETFLGDVAGADFDPGGNEFAIIATRDEHAMS